MEHGSRWDFDTVQRLLCVYEKERRDECCLTIHVIFVIVWFKLLLFSVGSMSLFNLGLLIAHVHVRNEQNYTFHSNQTSHWVI